MTEQNEYERMGRFIYGAFRHGADISAVHGWMADDLNVQRLDTDDVSAANSLYKKFFAKYENDDAFEVNFQSFLEAIQQRSA